MVKLRYIGMAIVFIIMILFMTGGAMNEQCTSIGECNACWKTTPIIIKSEMCPDPTKDCQALPAQQQHNALVDMLVCACTKTKASNYADGNMNSAIESATREMFGNAVPVQDLCENPANVLVRQQYG